MVKREIMRMSPFERAKMNGGVPNISPLRAEAMAAEEAPAKGEGEEGAGGPPNLRDCWSSPECCDNCGAYEYDQDGGSCQAHEGYPCKPNQVCDDYRPEGEEDGKGEAGAEAES